MIHSPKSDIVHRLALCRGFYKIMVVDRLSPFVIRLRPRAFSRKTRMIEVSLAGDFVAECENQNTSNGYRE